MELIDLRDIDDAMLPLVGGKAIGLARLIEGGERVPPGFCVTTDVFRSGVVPRKAVVERWRSLLDAGPVAVRSSATAEDLPDASFAGLQDTVLEVTTDDELVAAIEQCWRSLDHERATTYRAVHAAGAEAAMGVVVQRMVDARAAGVLFTANPVTGTRTQQVVDATAGLGDAVVSGEITAEHAELDDGSEPAAIDCLSAAELRALQLAGRRIEHDAGEPQDIEFAVDHDGELWLLQSRAITTLFPVPAVTDGMHAYLDVGHTQGMLQPMTPMGQSVMLRVCRDAADAFGLPLDRMVTFIGGRMYFDLTPMLRSRALRSSLPALLHVYGPGAEAAADTLLHDARLRPSSGPPVHAMLTAAGRMLGATARFMPTVVVGAVQALIDPARVRAKAHAATVDRVAASTASEHLEAARELQGPLMAQGMMQMTPALYGGIIAREAARGLLAHIAAPGDVERTQRGMPHNPTTEMDLALWRVAERAAEHRELFAQSTASELTARLRSGDLPDVGIAGFLERYGHRCAAEIDVGVARWSESPEPVLAAIAGYLDVVGTDAAPDRRFAQAATEADQTIVELEAKARASGHPLRGAVAGWLLRRTRALAGLRELPKFVWVQAIRDVRVHLQAVGAELVGRGLLDAADDVFMLELPEATRAIAGADLRDRVATRAATHRREMRRTRVPAVLLSDGTELRPAASIDGAIVGTAAAAGTATGRARVVRDPRDARIAPGEILVAPTTDPGWTPLFMTAGGLVTETGSPMAHGPTVAREYGIPAVIGVHEATTRITTGDLLTIDGSAGTVRVDEPASATADTAPASVDHPSIDHPSIDQQVRPDGSP